MSDKKSNKLLTVLGEVATAENIQKYILGTKKTGQPRAVYDVVKDYTKPKKKKNKKGSGVPNTFDVYFGVKSGKKKNKKKKDKYWRV